MSGPAPPSPAPGLWPETARPAGGVADQPGPRPGSGLALAALTAIAALSPWPFGSAVPLALAAVTAVALASAGLALAAAARGGGLALPALRLWPLGGFVALCAAQLVPLPPALHSRLAPGSALVWHPAEAAAAAVLGASARPVSIDPVTTLRGLALLAGLCLLALVAAPALGSAAGSRRALSALAGVGFAVAAYAVWARARFGPLLYGVLTVPTIAPFGPFVNKNHFAGWAAVAALLAAGLAGGLVAEAGRRGRDWTLGGRSAGVVLAGLASLAMTLAVTASLSRGGALAVAAGAFCFGAQLFARARPRRVPARVPALALAVALVATVLALAPSAAHERLRTLGGAEFRLSTWRDAWRLAAASPLVGHGLGAFHDAFPRVKRDNGALRVEHAESEYLETLAETGAAGLALALCGVLALVRSGVGRGKGGVSRVSRGVAQGAVAALAALAVHSAVDFPLRVPAVAALAALAAASVAGAAGVRPARLSPACTSAAALGAVALLAAALAAPGRSPGSLREDARLAAAALSPQVRALRLERAEAALAGALRARPADAESWLLLAAVRAARGDPASAASLARHAAWLDPARPDLGAAARRLAAPIRPDRPSAPAADSP